MVVGVADHLVVVVEEYLFVRCSLEIWGVLDEKDSWRVVLLVHECYNDGFVLCEMLV